MKIYLDGKFVDEADAKVSVFDHGLLYGDGCFEGIGKTPSLHCQTIMSLLIGPG